MSRAFGAKHMRTSGTTHLRGRACRRQPNDVVQTPLRPDARAPSPRRHRDDSGVKLSAANLLCAARALLFNSRAMATLVFDIETSGLPPETFDEAQREYLFRDAERLPEGPEREARRAEIQRQFSLWPFTAQVVCIAMVNAETGRGQVLFLSEDCEEATDEPGPVKYVPCADEVELLTAFWEVAPRYDSIVTFNGRGFDVPFLYLRSAQLNVPITRKDWLGYRFNVEPHCDLAEQLTFYSVSGRDGAARKFNLDFYCKAFGIPSPKAEGVTGNDIGQLMADGRHRDIAEYCLRDVKATVLLYQIWQARLKGVK